ncbi:MAG TPA: TPM domain-containing protein [Pyrinomonadaceae bacterium]|jgi:uncharacterized membrane protein YgcG
MKRVLFITALLTLNLFVACRQTQTAEQANANNTPDSRAGAGKAFTSTEQTNTNQSNTGQTNNAAEAESLLLPQPSGFVNDFAKVLDEQSKARLDELVRKLKERSRIEFAVVTVETTGKQDIFDYSLALARNWGVGSKPRGDGLLLLVAVKDRKWRVQVSRSLEADLPNDAVGELGSLMNEPFRRGDYGEGLTKCVEAIIARLSDRRGFKNN